MKALKQATRTLTIGVLWSGLFMFWLQSFMIANWRFNPLVATHWRYIWRMWLNGWVIDKPQEWMFVITIFAFIPVWLTGWTILCSIPWAGWFFAFFGYPFRVRKRKKLEAKKGPVKVQRRKSHKETRPPVLRAPTGKVKLSEAGEQKKAAEAEAVAASAASSTPSAPRRESAPKPAPAPSHSVAPAPAPAKKGASSTPAPSKPAVPGETVVDVLRNAGYKILDGMMVGKQKIDHIALSARSIILCLVDAEEGDWLADEERFNDEEPLWFSESNHRVSPVRQVMDSREILSDILADRGNTKVISAMVVVRLGTVINAEDMVEIWNDLDVVVSRIGEGGPDELKRFADILSQNNNGDISGDDLAIVEKAIADSVK